MSRSVLIVLLALAALPAAAQDAVIRISRQPDGPVMLGQPVRLFVDVLFPQGMGHPPRVEAPRVTGAQVFRFESQAATIEDRTGGTPVTGQRFEFDLYARRAGRLAVPPFEVTLLDAAGDPAGTRASAPLSIAAVVPPGLDASGPIVASDDVSLKDRWESPATSLHVGDALVRVVTRQAADVPGLALANLAFPAPDGVRAYVDPPVIEDSIERGSVTGRRTDRVAYVFERPGTYALPGVTQPWWDLDGRSAHVLSSPARHVNVPGPATPAAAPDRSWMVAVGVLLCLALACAAGVHLRRRPRATDAERAAFRALDRACRDGDAVSIYRAWQRWNALRADRVLRPDLASSLAALERHLFAHRGEWTAAAARHFAAAARAARFTATKHVRPGALPPLNPLP